MTNSSKLQKFNPLCLPLLAMVGILVSASMLSGCSQDIDQAPALERPTFSSDDIAEVREVVDTARLFHRDYGESIIRAADPEESTVVNLFVIVDEWNTVLDSTDIFSLDTLERFPPEFASRLATFYSDTIEALEIWWDYAQENYDQIIFDWPDYEYWKSQNGFSDSDDATIDWFLYTDQILVDCPSVNAPPEVLDIMSTQSDLDWLSSALDEYHRELQEWESQDWD